MQSNKFGRLGLDRRMQRVVLLSTILFALLPTSVFAEYVGGSNQTIDMLAATMGRIPANNVSKDRADYPRRVLDKWNRPIIYFAKVEDGPVRAAISNFIYTFQQTTGHDIERTADIREANFAFIDLALDKTDEWKKFGDNEKTSDPLMETLIKEGGNNNERHCVGLNSYDKATKEKQTAMAFVRSDRNSEQQSIDCFAETFAKEVGFAGNLALSPQSIRNEGINNFSEDEQFLLRVLYDDRLVSGSTIADSGPTFEYLLGEYIERKKFPIYLQNLPPLDP